MAYRIFVIATAITLNCFATTPILFGHNLAPTAETMSKGDWTVGTYYAGVGVTDNITVGLSTWMIWGYNLDNVILRFRHPFFAEEISHQVAYFKSNEQWGTRYVQESISYWLTYPFKFERYTFNTTLNYMYFWNELRPFSLRREPFNNQAQQITISTLHQFYFSETTTLQFELGILGANYVYPNLDIGASIAFRPLNQKWLLQIGASVSNRYSGPLYPDNPQNLYIDSYENYAGVSLHPEVQIQYWF